MCHGWLPILFDALDTEEPVCFDYFTTFGRMQMCYTSLNIYRYDKENYACRCCGYDARFLRRELNSL